MARKKHPSIKHVPQDKSPTAAELEWAKANNPSGVHAIIARIDAESAKATTRAKHAELKAKGHPPGSHNV